jgi:hypothetical protein
MRYVLLALVMTGAFLVLVTWTTKPEMLEAQYAKLAEPIEQHFAEQQAAALQAARERALRQWLAHMPVAKGCLHPRSALRDLECKNQVEMQKRKFETYWSQKIASGWKPEDMN